MSDDRDIVVVRFRRQSAMILHRDHDGKERSVSEHPFGHNADELTAATVEQVKAGKTNVLFDLGQVDWFGSTAIGLLIQLWKATETLDARATCVNLSDRVLSTFKATFVDQIFHISGTIEDGEAYVQG